MERIARLQRRHASNRISNACTGGFLSADGEADMLTADATVTEWLHMIRAEYLEMPGLNLTESQVRRLWNLDQVTCEALLSALVDVKFLRRTDRGAYVRAD